MPTCKPSGRDRERDSVLPRRAAAGARRGRLSGRPPALGLDAVPGAVLLLDRDLRVLAANRAATVIAGIAAEDLLGLPFEDLLTVPGRLLFQTHVFPALAADGRVEEAFLTCRSESGEATPILLNAEALDAGPVPELANVDGAVGREDAGQPAYAFLLVRIRARGQWEHDLLETMRALEAERSASRRLASDLEAASRDLEARHAEERRNRQFRDAFIGVVSHELRTPITTIYGMSHLVRRGLGTMDSPTVAAHLKDIEAEANRLRALTEDLLVLSRAEAGRLIIAAEPLLLGHVARSVVETEARRLASHALELEVEPDLPLVLGEEVHVGQVIRNFLSNAVKYSPSGTRIQTSVMRELDGAALRVLDEGPGLGAEPPERLFELFFRTADAVKSTSGAGIGLFVSRELVVAMGGRIWARPGPGRGAEFGFWLPGVDETVED